MADGFTGTISQALPPEARLELEFEVELGAARGIGGYRLAEEWGIEDPDVGQVVGVVEDVERIEGDREGGDVFLFFGLGFGENEIV